MTHAGDAPSGPSRIIELLSSRLCHDLISPVAAVNNGMEMLEDAGEFGGDADFQAEATALVRDAGKRAAAALMLYRLAYGGGIRAAHGFDDLTKAAEAYFATRTITLDPLDGRTLIALATLTSADPNDPAAAAQASGKLLLNALLTASQCLPQGGRLRVSPTEVPTGVTITAEGRGAKVDPALADAAAGTVAMEALDPKTVQGYFLRSISLDLGCAPMLTAGPSESVALHLAAR